MRESVEAAGYVVDDSANDVYLRIAPSGLQEDEPDARDYAGDYGYQRNLYKVTITIERITE